MSEYICTICEYEGRGIKRKRGSRGMEIFIWAVLFVPGPLYYIYRRFFLKRECPHCSATSMVPANSKEGRLIREKLDEELGLVRDGKQLQKAKPIEKKTLDIAPKDNIVPAEERTKIDPDQW